MSQVLLKLFPIQTKSTSDLFRYARNTLIFSLNVLDDQLIFKLFGLIPVFTIKRSDIISIEKRKEFLVGLTAVFNPLFLKYKKGERVKERVISMSNKAKSERLFTIIQEWLSSSLTVKWVWPYSTLLLINPEEHLFRIDREYENPLDKRQFFGIIVAWKRPKKQLLKVPIFLLFWNRNMPASGLPCLQIIRNSSRSEIRLARFSKKLVTFPIRRLLKCCRILAMLRAWIK